MARAKVRHLDLTEVPGAGAPFLEFSWHQWQIALFTNTSIPASASISSSITSAAPTSVHEHIPLKEASAYCAAKGGLGLLTKVMALELGEHGVAVNSVAPGEIATPMTGQVDQDPGQEDRPIPLGRPGDAREVAAFVAFLASPEARYATGESIVVDGGLTLIAAQANANG